MAQRGGPGSFGARPVSHRPPALPSTLLAASALHAIVIIVTAAAGGGRTRAHEERRQRGGAQPERAAQELRAAQALLVPTLAPAKISLPRVHLGPFPLAVRRHCSDTRRPGPRRTPARCCGSATALPRRLSSVTAPLCSPMMLAWPHSQSAALSPPILGWNGSTSSSSRVTSATVRMEAHSSGRKGRVRSPSRALAVATSGPPPARCTGGRGHHPRTRRAPLRWPSSPRLPKGLGRGPRSPRGRGGGEGPPRGPVRPAQYHEATLGELVQTIAGGQGYGLHL
jgi:hypothetical protein